MLSAGKYPHKYTKLCCSVLQRYLLRKLLPLSGQARRTQSSKYAEWLLGIWKKNPRDKSGDY